MIWVNIVNDRKATMDKFFDGLKNNKCFRVTTLYRFRRDSAYGYKS